MTNDTGKIQSFTHHVELLEGGKLSKELNDKLRELIGDIENCAAENGGKGKGEITLKLSFKLDKGIYELGGDFSVKAPKRYRRVMHAYATPDNNLTLNNPQQVEMFGGRGARLVGGNEGAQVV